MISSASTLAEDIRYGLAHWQGLTRFLDDGRLELDNNPVENAIRPGRELVITGLYHGDLQALPCEPCRLHHRNP